MTQYLYGKKKHRAGETYKITFFPENQETTGDKETYARGKEEEKNQVMHAKNRQAGGFLVE